MTGHAAEPPVGSGRLQQADCGSSPRSALRQFGRPWNRMKARDQYKYACSVRLL